MNVISTRNLKGFSPVPLLLRAMQSLAMLDALIEEEWQDRYFSFNAKWSDTEQMGSMRNGSGDDLFAVFDQHGCLLRGFDHESPMSPWNNKPKRVWKGVLDEVPSQFSSSLSEPAFHMDDSTFCIWRGVSDTEWQRGKIEFPEGDDPDGSGWMLSAYDGEPATYLEYVRDYFEIDLDLNAITAVFDHAPLTAELISRFPRSRDMEKLAAEAVQIGYPS